MELAEICLFLEKDRGKLLTSTAFSDRKQAENDVKSVALGIISLMLANYNKKC